MSDDDLIYGKKNILALFTRPLGDILPANEKCCAGKFLRNLKTNISPNCLSYTCVNDAYPYFICSFVEAINFIALVKRISEGQLKYKDGINCTKNLNRLILKLRSCTKNEVFHKGFLTGDLFTFTEEIVNGKPNLLRSQSNEFRATKTQFTENDN